MNQFANETSYLKAEYRVYVNRGVDLLDRYFGDRSSWVDRIEVDRLEMSNECNCILGQLFDHYVDGLIALNDSRLGCQALWGHQYGFTTGIWSHDHFIVLNQLWLEVLKETNTTTLG